MVKMTSILIANRHTHPPHTHYGMYPCVSFWLCFKALDFLMFVSERSVWIQRHLRKILSCSNVSLEKGTRQCWSQLNTLQVCDFSGSFDMIYIFITVFETVSHGCIPVEYNELSSFPQHLFCWSRYTFNSLNWTPPTYGFRLWIFKWLSCPTMETDSRGDLLCAGEATWRGDSVYHLQCRRSVFKWCKYFLENMTKQRCSVLSVWGMAYIVGCVLMVVNKGTMLWETEA